MRRAFALVLLTACSGAGSAPEPLGQTSEAYTQQCPTSVVEGVDVYDGQGAITWSSVAASGRAFAFIKATQGDYDTQSTFAANYRETKAAGVLRSPYHFFDATIDGVTQANHFLSVVDAQGGILPGDLPAMLDLECPTSSDEASTEASCEYTGNSGWAPTATLIERVFDWLTTVEQATGKKPIIYSYPSWFADAAFTDARLAAYPLYIATYGTCASVPAPWTTAVFWQYSATATVSGISGEVDVDRFFGTKAELGAFASPADAGVDGSDAAAPSDGGADARDDAGDAEATSPIEDAQANGGCSCRAGASSSRASDASWLGALVVALAAARRRRSAVGPREVEQLRLRRDLRRAR
jgi:lysozyme